MTETILAQEPLLRLSVFLGVLVAMVAWELAAPGRHQEIPRVVRWTNNLALVVVDTVILRLSFPILAVGLALVAEERGWGLFNVLDVPLWMAVGLSMLLLDLAIYLQHVLFHAVPGLWRLHRMHHADLEFDATTGLRFHPVEILISMAIKLVVVAALGAPAVAVLIFEALLNATAMFNHANIRLHAGVDRVLRWIVVTPDMHRVHHSVIPAETNSNFGFNLPWWDRLLGTYRAQPKAGHDSMTIGIEQFRTPRDLWLDRMLIQPLHGPASGGALDAGSDKAPPTPETKVYTGGTTLLTEAYRPAERGRAQAANDMTIFVVGLASSLGAGALMQSVGWQTMNLLLLPWMAAAALALVWLGWRRRSVRISA